MKRSLLLGKYVLLVCGLLIGIASPVLAFRLILNMISSSSPTSELWNADLWFGSLLLSAIPAMVLLYLSGTLLERDLRLVHSIVRKFGAARLFFLAFGIGFLYVLLAACFFHSCVFAGQFFSLHIGVFWSIAIVCCATFFAPSLIVLFLIKQLAHRYLSPQEPGRGAVPEEKWG
ncbi:hypothetical protein JW916_07780 [Candidatus Sumerlaeota bacterium]|nr:hypothetical protein [Candidatus Sumerlaeota bacterium]